MSEVPASEAAAGAEVQEPTAAQQPEKGADEVEEGQIVSPSKPLPKHELEYEWALWFDNPGGRQNVSGYGQSLRMVYSFKTVEDFWCLFNNIKPPSMFQPNVTYYLFKKDIEPKWESPANASGGSWSANIPQPKNHEAKRRLDEWWMHAVMACIGERRRCCSFRGVAAG
jgi:translation initiation factor 4E